MRYSGPIRRPGSERHRPPPHRLGRRRPCLADPPRRPVPIQRDHPRLAHRNQPPNTPLPPRPRNFSLPPAAASSSGQRPHAAARKQRQAPSARRLQPAPAPSRQCRPAVRLPWREPSSTPRAWRPPSRTSPASPRPCLRSTPADRHHSRLARRRSPCRQRPTPPPAERNPSRAGPPRLRPLRRCRSVVWHPHPSRSPVPERPHRPAIVERCPYAPCGPQKALCARRCRSGQARHTERRQASLRRRAAAAHRGEPMELAPPRRRRGRRARRRSRPWPPLVERWSCRCSRAPAPPCRQRAMPSVGRWRRTCPAACAAASRRLRKFASRATKSTA